MENNNWVRGSLSLEDKLKAAANEDFLSLASRLFKDNVHQAEESDSYKNNEIAILSGSSGGSQLALTDSAEDTDVVFVNDSESVVSPKLPPKAPLYRPPLDVGTVYIVKAINTNRNVWSRAKLLSIIYNVRQGVTNNRCMVKYSNGFLSRRHVEASEMAYLEECPTMIPLGTAVVTNSMSRNAVLYYSGVVLELPNAMNKFRYLVFLDKGSVCYTQHCELRVVCGVHQANISPIDRLFVRDYLNLYPDRFLLRLKVGEKVEVNRKCEWMEGTVQSIDCSIVQLRFSEGSVEWYSRGCYRFRKVLYEQPSTYRERLQCIQEEISPKLTEEPDEGPTSTQRQLVPARFLTNRNVSKLPSQETTNALTVITPLLLYWPNDLGLHSCDSRCVPGEDIIQRINPKYGSLVWPLSVGFRRLNQAGTISYKAPCGQLLRNYSQLENFLNCTKICLDYDHFDFSPYINAQRIYEPNPNSVLASVEDISNGSERFPISCVNEVNNLLPEPLTYITKRKFQTYSHEVTNDGDFVSCCSCNDDCKDADKCECIQLTIKSYLEVEGLDTTPLPPSEIRYKHKRLLNEIQSGIYECNRRCRCSSGCANRMVQLPTTAKLQVFQAGKKGWAVRALHDLPKGSFVCTYVGLILDEREANEWGRLHGDEFLTDLDFIKESESLKPGYEAEVAEMNMDVAKHTSVANGESSKPAKRSKTHNNPTPPKRRSSRAHPQPASKVKKRRYTNKKRVVHELPRSSIKWFFPSDLSEFTIDAKNSGNVGRYFNHACEPNMFVQNVFVDTHDLRLPWVSFFTLKDIAAGTELTWDYGYKLGSVIGKRLYCFCLASGCKRRLY